MWVETKGSDLVEHTFDHDRPLSTPLVKPGAKKCDYLRIADPRKQLLTIVAVNEYLRHFDERLPGFDQHQKGCQGNVRKSGCFFKRVRPGAPERFNHLLRNGVRWQG